MRASERSRAAPRQPSAPPSPTRPQRRWPGAILARGSNRSAFFAVRAILQMDVDQLAYTLNERLKQLTQPRRILTYCALTLSFSVIIFTALFWFFTSGGDRWVINPVVSEFEFPLIPENALKVYACCKYLISLCIAYNYAKYVLERKKQLLYLMDSLELETTKMTGESRLDATVPRPGDDAKTREAREMIAIRRLRCRGVFSFDVIPEPNIPREPDPTEEEIQLIREALELDAVKKLNDPKMLREYIRRRESRMGRRKVNMTRNKDRRRTNTKKSLKLDPLLNAIKEEDSSSQLSDQTISRIFPSEMKCFRRRSFRGSNSRICGKTDSDDSEWSEMSNANRPMKHGQDRLLDNRTLHHSMVAARWPAKSRSRGYGKCKPSLPEIGNERAPSATGSRPCSSVMYDYSVTRPAFPSGDATPKQRKYPAFSHRREHSHSQGSSSGSGRKGKGPSTLPSVVWESLSQTMTPSHPPSTDTPFVPRGPFVDALPTVAAGAGVKATEDRAGAGRTLAAVTGTAARSSVVSGHHPNTRETRRDSYDSPPCPSTTEEEEVDGRTAVFSSGDSASISDAGRSEGCSCGECRREEVRAEEGAKRDLEVAHLLQPRSGWSDSRSSLSGLSSSLTAFSDVAPSLNDDARTRFNR